MCKKFAFVAVLLLAASVAPSSAQQRSSAQVTLRQLTRPAGYIFVGRVKSVQYLPAHTSRQVAIVRIRFQVEQGLRGVRSGKQLTIRQWAGLWDEGERYRTGERLLLFLYPSSKLGLTSSVGGSRGRFAFDHNGQVLLGMERASLLRDFLPRRERDRVPLRDFLRGLRGLQEE
jgi:hypothetical protein